MTEPKSDQPIAGFLLPFDLPRMTEFCRVYIDTMLSRPMRSSGNDVLRLYEAARYLMGEVTILRAALEKIQFSYPDTTGTDRLCPECHWEDPANTYKRRSGDAPAELGHRPDCSIGAALNPPTAPEKS